MSWLNNDLSYGLIKNKATPSNRPNIEHMKWSNNSYFHTYITVTSEYFCSFVIFDAFFGLRKQQLVPKYNCHKVEARSEIIMSLRKYFNTYRPHERSQRKKHWTQSLLESYKEIWVFKNDSAIGFLPEHRGQTAKLAGLYPWQCGSISCWFWYSSLQW